MNAARKAVGRIINECMTEYMVSNAMNTLVAGKELRGTMRDVAVIATEVMDTLIARRRQEMCDILLATLLHSIRLGIEHEVAKVYNRELTMPVLSIEYGTPATA